MPRNMLQLRIEALSRHLMQAQDPVVWKQTLDLPKFNVDDLLWDLAVDKIHLEAGAQLQQLKHLGKRLRDGKLDETQGWREYSRIQGASDEILRECLDLLGGLALRDRIQEERICQVADAYIKELSSDTARRQSFAIPGLDAGSPSILRRVAKMQFPEWTVWTLPLVAHEYGHVVIEESGLKGFAAELTEKKTETEIGTERPDMDGKLLELGTNLHRVVQDLGRDEADNDKDLLELRDRLPWADWSYLTLVQRRHRNRTRILLADAIATLMAGPAYAFAALLLRLNPLGRVSDDGADDQERAATILAVLNHMNMPGPGGQPVFNVMVERLEEYWRTSAAEAKDQTPQEAAAVLDKAALLDPEVVRSMFRKHIVGHKRALYERQHWVNAVQWSNAWKTDLGLGEGLKAPDTKGDEHIREAINAVWHARIEATIDLDAWEDEEARKRIEFLEVVGLQLCEDIIKPRLEKGNDPGGGTDPGPAVRPR
jgi:hypothetical protein